jgi:hypothetical protein
MMLLEVLIAFALIVLCALPLIAPHVGLLKVQHQFLRKVDLDHAINLLYGSVLEQLYMNSIGWADLMQNQFPIPEQEFQRLGYFGSYNFNEVAPTYKPRDPEAPYALYRLTLTFNFIPLEFARASDEIKQKNTLKYRYEVFVVRDRRQTEEQTEEPGEADDKES